MPEQYWDPAANGGAGGFVGVSPSTPLPTAAKAGENHLGSVGGATARVSPAVVVSTSPYVPGYVVGGLLTLTNALRAGGPGTGHLESVAITDKSNQNAALNIYILNAAPSGGTYADRGALVWGSGDAAKILHRISVAASDYGTDAGLATASIAQGLRDLEAASGTTLYAIITTRGTPTYGASGDLSVGFGIIQD